MVRRGAFDCQIRKKAASVDVNLCTVWHGRINTCKYKSVFCEKSQWKIHKVHVVHLVVVLRFSECSCNINLTGTEYSVLGNLFSHHTGLTASRYSTWRVMPLSNTSEKTRPGWTVLNSSLDTRHSVSWPNNPVFGTRMSHDRICYFITLSIFGMYFWLYLAASNNWIKFILDSGGTNK